MPLYNSSYMVSVVLGQSITLFDGTETPGAAVKSIAFVPKPSPTQRNPTTFTIDFGSAPTAVVLIQGSNSDVEANYQTLKTSTNTQHDNYTNSDYWAFYRAVLSTYSAGGMPVVVAQR